MLALENAIDDQDQKNEGNDESPVSTIQPGREIPKLRHEFMAKFAWPRLQEVTLKGKPSGKLVPQI